MSGPVCAKCLLLLIRVFIFSPSELVALWSVASTQRVYMLCLISLRLSHLNLLIRKKEGNKPSDVVRLLLIDCCQLNLVLKRKSLSTLRAPINLAL